jgi:hypothetical protein
MLTTDTVTCETVTSDNTADRAVSTKLAGAGALAFAGIVILQNVIRGSSAPSNGASAAEVLTHAADSRGLTFALVATFVVGGISLTTFLGGAMRRLTGSARQAWAYTGYVGAAGVLALFAVLLASEQAISVVAHGTDPDLGAVSALWALHNSVFTVLLLFIGIALLGLGRAGVAAGITPRAFEWLAPLGTGLLAVACVAGPGIAAGELGGLFGFGLAGFVIWLAFLITTGLRLVRASGPRAVATAA